MGTCFRDVDVQARVLEAIVEALPVEKIGVEESLRSVTGLGPTMPVVSLLGALWSASVLSTAVRRSIDVVFDVDSPRALLHGKLVDYSLLPVGGALCLGSFVLTAGWRVVQARAGDRFATFDGVLA